MHPPASGPASQGPLMTPELVSIIALILLFVVGTLLPINMGALGFVAAWLVGKYTLGLTEREIISGISGDLVLTLVGVTYLFAIAKNNGTVDLIVRKAVQAVRGRVVLIPWVMFAQAGGSAPITVSATIANSVMRENDLPVSEAGLFLASLLVNLAIAVVLFLA